jgi:hypothetical protein
LIPLSMNGGERIKRGQRLRYSGALEIRPLTVSVRGRYRSLRSIQIGDEVLDLRVDVDGATADLWRVSADTFAVKGPGDEGLEYKNSWIMHRPEVGPVHNGRIRIGGGIEISEVTRDATDRHYGHALVRAAIDGREVNVAIASPTGAITHVCPRYSDHFRTVDLTIDPCERTLGPERPIYDTTYLPMPAGVVPRILPLEAVFADAGIELNINVRRMGIADGDSSLERWSDADLRRKLERGLSKERLDSNWPPWSIWGFLAKAHENRGLAGLMFDTVNVRQRRAFAIFRECDLFAALPETLPLPDGSSPTAAQAEAMRLYLFAWVHELGHVLNLPHSRHSSWMSTQPLRNVRAHDVFFRDFQFTFSDEELMHIRHASLPTIRMGGDAFVGSEGKR